jgi:hypothetical protein
VDYYADNRLNRTNGHPIENQIHTIGDARYRLVKTNHQKVWHGFTWNPSLLKMDNYYKFGKYSDYGSEYAASVRYYELGFRAAKCIGGYVKHLGWGRHVG